MAATTREHLLATARQLFAERGFYGVSIANIADAHGLTKQALLHHFSTKEKLYGEILKEISAELSDHISVVKASSATPEQRLQSFFRRMTEEGEENAIRTRLLMRELLDNKRRAETSGKWYLKGFLGDLVGMLKATPEWNVATDSEALAAVYQLLGAVNYFLVSEPTLRGILGKKGADDLAQAFPQRLEVTVEGVLRSPPLR